MEVVEVWLKMEAVQVVVATMELVQVVKVEQLVRLVAITIDITYNGRSLVEWSSCTLVFTIHFCFGNLRSLSYCALACVINM